MRPPVYVAGIGAITAIGLDVPSCLASLLTGTAGMGPIRWLDTIHRNKIPVAEVKADNQTLARLSGLSPDIPRTALLSAQAAREAMTDAGLPELRGLRTGFISANSVGGMDTTEDFFAGFMQDPAAGQLKKVQFHECGSITELVADLLGIKDFISTISTACSSSANAIFSGARMIEHNLLDIVVAGGADALTKFTLNGFNTLMILDKELSRPFDENRHGLNLGEGAGYVVLVSERVLTLLNKAPYGRLSGYCNANDAFHQTASSPQGTGSLLAMRGALASAGLTAADIDYINLHGTGTQNNDIAEGTAISTLFDPAFPHMSSTKSFTGHTLGGCGGIEAVFSILAIREGLIFPNLRLETPMKELPFIPERRLLTGQSLKHVLSNSFGFGGNCSSLIFSAS